ncbi:VanY-A/VanY-F/VanY-M family D-Ala-D-Ala carboxypeptidase [Rossellomorea yichunensis]|uniref:VanY-A/VanY-F/VanY-M family D-Ala-D-Ala carboxypeptidase n=1 Tax=Rossellomorea yichunensis TaxID=3077331 RepID=UPI0028DD5FC4|nr:VanY-A/VanY-F/VanY-M family D-Ala-D-Ala carboxypeptidase [Rossellomorea sp. YC4-1]MDT9025562.1 VanY-A/VanY-F/VanY-M family D-Ala-D-Ala carboxypeptidase [Rossellomorea sp. YC4-1]
MKKWGFLILSCLGLTFVYMGPLSEPEVKIQNHVQSENGIAEGADTQEIKITEDHIYRGDLLLVNSEYPVHQESIRSDIVNLSANNELAQGYVLLGSDIYLSEDIAHTFSEMVAAAKKDSLRHFAITSGFRGFDEQSVLYEDMGSDYALPAGYSEHNLGLSLDVGSTQMKMANAPEGKWIEKYAWKYGFILRYPENKTDITGIQYEPWHIRYVGFPHSAIMKSKNFVLEEYLEYLKEEKTISASVHGEKYEISYYPVTKRMTIHVPRDLRYEISGNNIDGVIVTVFPDAE